jgi:anti-anti-sigma factor
MQSRETSRDRCFQSPLGLEEGEVRLECGEAVAVAFLAMPCIRDHQAQLLEVRLCGMAERAGGRLAVSLAEVDDITSAGINALVVVHAHCRKLGGHLALFGLSRQLRELLKLTHLDQAFVIATTSQEAANSFSPPGPRRWGLLGSRRRKAA